MQEKGNYVLDFVIPAGEKGNMGPTGPKGDTGPQGNIGPTGPTMIKAILSLDYTNTSTSGNVPIASTNRVLIPNNESVFSFNTNEITLNEDGFYEFSIFGKLKETTTPKTVELILKIENTDFASFTLTSDENELYFSSIRFKQCNRGNRILIEFNKASNSNASCEQVYLIIKKFVIAN